MIIEGLSQLNLAEYILHLENEDMLLTTYSLYLQKMERLVRAAPNSSRQISPPRTPTIRYAYVCIFTEHYREPFRSELSGTHNGRLQTRDQFNNYKSGERFVNENCSQRYLQAMLVCV